MEKSLTFYQKACAIMETSIQCRSVESFYGAVSKMFDVDLVVADHLLCPIAYPKGIIPDVSWEDLVHLDLVPPLAWIANLPNCEYIMQKGPCRMYRWSSQKSCSAHIFIDIERNNRKQAYLTAVARGETVDIDYELKELLLLLAGSISVHFESKTGHLIENSVFEHYMVDLIEDRFDNSNEEDLFHQTGLKAAGFYNLLLVDINRWSVIRSLHSFRILIEQAVHVTRSVLYNDQIILLLCARNQKIAETRDYTQLEALLEEQDTYAAVSRTFSNLWTLHRYYSGANKILLHSVCAPPGTRVLSAENMSVAFVVDSLLRTESPEDLIDPRVWMLLNYDSKNGTEYIKTLFSYLRHAHKIAITCEELHIHRNTLDYRLRKISELTGIDWTNGDQHFRLYLSLSAFKLMKQINLWSNHFQ